MGLPDDCLYAWGSVCMTHPLSKVLTAQLLSKLCFIYSISLYGAASVSVFACLRQCFLISSLDLSSTILLLSHSAWLIADQMHGGPCYTLMWEKLLKSIAGWHFVASPANWIVDKEFDIAWMIQAVRHSAIHFCQSSSIHRLRHPLLPGGSPGWYCLVSVMFKTSFCTTHLI